MMNAKGLAQIRKNLQRWSGLSTKRFTLERQVSHGSTDPCTTQLAQKGHFVVYTVDGKRFEIPLDYLNNRIVSMLIKLSEEEFGYSAGGPITLPCDGDFMQYVMDLVRRQVSGEVERAIANLLCIPCHHACSLPSKVGADRQQLEVY